MSNILEICFKDLSNQKTLLEGRLEVVVNDPILSNEIKFNRSMELLKEINEIQGLLGLVTIYITQNKKEESKEK